VAGGGTSTMAWTFEGKLRTLWNKTLRWPGHFAQWKAYMDAGLLETEPVEVGGLSVVRATSSTPCSTRRSAPSRASPTW